MRWLKMVESDDDYDGEFDSLNDDDHYGELSNLMIQCCFVMVHPYDG